VSTVTTGMHLDLLARLDALRDAVESAQKTLSVQFGWEFALAGMPDKPNPLDCEFGSTIALTGTDTRYTYAVVCNETAAKAFTRAFFDMETTEDPGTADIADAINELPNVAAGVWKARREKRGEAYQLGLPIFMRGNSWLQYFSKGVNAIAQPLKDPAGHVLQVVLIWQSGDVTEGCPVMTTATTSPVETAVSLPLRVLQEAVESTVATCAIQMKLPLTVAENPGDPREAQVDFGSTIALTTEHGGGWNLAVMADQKSCNALTRVLFAMEPDEEPEREDLADGLGEIVNVAAGVLKAKRLEAGQKVQLGLPLFMEGRGCIEFFASGLQGISQNLQGPDGLSVHVILIWQEG
jgi:CheY-specific phosphatase CheX